jgi:hypothetical protein
MPCPLSVRRGPTPRGAAGGCRLQELAPLVVQLRRRLHGEVAELVAVAVGGEHGEPALGLSKRHGLASELDRRGQLGVLEGVLPLDQLGRDQPFLAGLTQPVDALVLVRVVGAPLGLVQRLQLVAREEVGVAGDDRGLLRRLLLAHAHRAPLLGALVDVRPQTRFELVGRANDDGRHRAEI